MRGKERAVGVERLARAAVVAATFLAGGCAGEGGAAGRSVSADSAGVEIVTSASPAWSSADAWTVDSVPELDLGVLDGPPELTFAGIRALRPLPDGGIVVAQRTELRLFDAAGRHVRTVGRAGDGPGEFRFLGTAEVCGGRIYAADFLTGMLTVLRLDGELDATMPLARADYATSRSLVGCAAGAPVFRVPFARATRETPPRTLRPEFALVTAGAGAAGEDTIAVLAGGENYDGLVVPFGRSTVFAFDSAARYVGDTGVPEIRVFGPDGVLRRIVRWTVEPQPVTGEAVDRIRAQYLDVPAAIADNEIRPRLDALVMPSAMPFFERLLVAPDGTIWLAPYYPFEQGEDRDWRVIAPDGRWLGFVTIPSGLDVHAITPDHLLGVWRDANDVEHVRRYRILR